MENSDDFEALRERLMKRTVEGMKTSYANEEYPLIQAINAYLQLGKVYNLIYERLAEWFGIYVPELDLQNPTTLSKLSLLVSEDKASKEKLLEIYDENTAQEVYSKIKATMGRKGTKEELLALGELAKVHMDMEKTLDSINNYVDETSKRLMPNVTFLTDGKTSAELLAKAGSLEKLATMPASTIQLLGAEKALFKHIKFGSKPPKYGILFKLSEVSSSPRHVRGRIARLYATKISIALKADCFSKRFIADKLKDTLKESIEKIKLIPEKPKVYQNSSRSWDNKDKGGYRNKDWKSGDRPNNRERTQEYRVKPNPRYSYNGNFESEKEKSQESSEEENKVGGREFKRRERQNNYWNKKFEERDYKNRQDRGYENRGGSGNYNSQRSNNYPRTYDRSENRDYKDNRPFVKRDDYKLGARKPWDNNKEDSYKNQGFRNNRPFVKREGYRQENRQNTYGNREFKSNSVRPERNYNEGKNREWVDKRKGYNKGKDNEKMWDSKNRDSKSGEFNRNKKKRRFN